MKPSLRIPLAAAVVVVAALSSAACGGGSSPSKSAGTSGGAITIVANSLPTGLDPDSTNAQDSGIQLTVSTSYMGLLFSYNGVAATGDTAPQTQPDLATGITEDPGGKSWTIKLRPGVKSQAGNPLTADDVVWTMQRVVNAKVNGSSLLSQSNVDLTNPVTKVDTETVRVNLTAPSALVEKIFSLPYLGILDSVEVKKHVTASDPWGTKWLASNTASFGPYTVTSIQPQTQIVMQANPNYWKGPAKITKATWRKVQDPSTTLQTVLAGQLDYVVTMAASNLKTLQSSPNVDTHVIPVPTTAYLTFDIKNAGVSNPLVRQAISMAIDRKAIADTVFGGTATPTTGCLPTKLTTITTPLDNAASPKIAEAKALLAQVPGQHTVAIGTLPSFYPESTAMGRIIQSNLAAIGVKAEIRPYTSISTITADEKSHALSGLLIKQAPYVPDAGYFFKAFFLSTSPYNFSNYKSAAFDAAANASMLQPAATRQTPIKEACTTFLKDAPAAMLVSSGNISVTRKGIQGVGNYSDIAPRLYNLTLAG